MKFYIDITLLTGTDIGLGFLWQKVFQQVHLALVENKVEENKSKIAVSFPNYNNKEFPLGNKLRLFAPTKEVMQQLDISKWLNRLTDYTHCTSIKETPVGVKQFACFKRKQFKSNLEKEAIRQANHKGIEISEALKHVKEHYDDKCKLPFINMDSLSTNADVAPSKRKRFKLFIEKESVNQASSGNYNCYGLSGRSLDKKVTIPWF